MHGLSGAWVGTLLSGAVALAPALSDAQQAPDLTGIDQLTQVLRPHGWGVGRADDGSLLLYPGIGGGASTDTASLKPNAGLARIRKLLGPHGWTVQPRPDGSLDLFPAASVASAAAEPTSRPGSTRVAALDLVTLEALLRDRGWSVRRTPAGNLEFYPPRVQDERMGRSVAPPAPNAPAWMQPPIEERDLALPLNAPEAGRLSRAWLTASGLPGLGVGRVRSVNRIYVVSIVEDRSPYRLHSQLVLRKRDGRLMVVQ